MVCLRPVQNCNSKKGTKCYAIKGGKLGIISRRKSRKPHKSRSKSRKKLRKSYKQHKKSVKTHPRSLITELKNMISGGYNGFVAPATGAIYNFIKLDNGVMTTIRHPFKNVKSTLKLILY